MLAFDASSDGLMGCSMPQKSQIVICRSSAEFHNLCVDAFGEMSHTVSMSDEADKNGGPNHLRAWRKFRELTKADLAEAVGTNANMIGYLENGERSLSLKWLRRLAPALDTNVGMLAQYDPNTLDKDLIEIWATVSTRDKARILEIAKLIVDDDRRDGTNDRRARCFRPACHPRGIGCCEDRDSCSTHSRAVGADASASAAD